MRLRLLAASLAALAPFAVTGGASAADDAFSLSPASGPAGTTVTVSDADDDCAVPSTATDPFALVVIAGDVALVTEGDTGVADSGAFSIGLTIPAGTTPGTYDVFVACYEGNDPDEDPYFEFGLREFTVTAAVAPTTPPVVTPATPARPAAPVAAPAPPRAQPATAVRAQPTYTG